MTPSRMTAANAERLLVFILRLNAGILLLALVAVFLPHEWMAIVNHSLFHGELPATPLVGYLTRSLSALYGFLGIVVWYVSRDVRRYRPLIAFQAGLTVVYGVALVGIDLFVGMPWLWTVSEAVLVIGMGLVMGWLAERARGWGGNLSEERNQVSTRSRTLTSRVRRSPRRSFSTSRS